MKLDTKHLATIEVIRREGGLTRAALALGTSQPALSRLVSDLEIRLDAPIFDRSARPWSLTKLGASLAMQGASILRAQELAGREVQEFRSGTKGMLRIAGPPFFTDGVISRLLPTFRDRHGSVSFAVSYGYGDELKDAVRHGRADLALFPRTVGEIAEDLVFTPLIEAHNVVACRAGHPILKLAFPRPLALLDYGWIVPPQGSPLAADMDMVLSELEMQEAEVVFEGGSLASVLSFLEGSDCLTVLPETTVAAIGSQFGIQAVPIQVRTPRRSLGILSRSPRELDNTSRTFVRFLQRHFHAGEPGDRMP
ncbi:MAG: LysR family transcriptional regulator [Boseongicola sp.]|nr:LysR family transcriptional regulator [Boseongicola sp.]